MDLTTKGLLQDNQGDRIMAEPDELPLDLSLKTKNLPPTKIKRTYKCKVCSHETYNPRDHLYHRISMHNHKLKVVECDLCVYACQYKQKLKRHRELVHLLKDSDSSAHKTVPSNQAQPQTSSCDEDY